MRIRDLADAYCMPRTTVSTIVKNKDIIKLANVAKGMKSLTKQRFPRFYWKETLLPNKENVSLLKTVLINNHKISQLQLVEWRSQLRCQLFLQQYREAVAIVIGDLPMLHLPQHCHGTPTTVTSQSCQMGQYAHIDSLPQGIKCHPNPQLKYTHYITSQYSGIFHWQMRNVNKNLLYKYFTDLIIMPSTTMQTYMVHAVEKNQITALKQLHFRIPKKKVNKDIQIFLIV